MSSYLIDEIEAAENIDVRPHAEVTGCSGDGPLETITLRDLAAPATARPCRPPPSSS